MCRVTIDGKATVLSTGLYCRPDDWNGKKGETKNIRTNGMLNDYKNRIDDTYNSLLKVNGVITAEDVGSATIKATVTDKTSIDANIVVTVTAE